MTKEGQVLNKLNSVDEMLELLSSGSSLDSELVAVSQADDPSLQHQVSTGAKLALGSPPDNLQRPIQEVAEDLTLEEVLNIWQSATDRLHDTHLTLQKEISRLSDELEEKNRQLAKKDRLADLGQMAAHVAHEVRNNLVPMTLYMNLLKRQLCSHSVSSDPGQDKSVQLLTRIEDGVESMRLMVSDLLNFTNDRQPELKQILLGQFLESLLQEVRPQCDAQGITIEVEIDCDADVVADVDMLKRATRNLLINAVDAMPEGGTLQVECQQQGETSSIHISDSGAGVDPTIMPQLFDPFVTTKDTGTGLGLSIVERIMEAHHGRIEFENRATGGARFSLILPNQE